MREWSRRPSRASAPRGAGFPLQAQSPTWQILVRRSSARNAATKASAGTHGRSRGIVPSRELSVLRTGAQLPAPTESSHAVRPCSKSPPPAPRAFCCSGPPPAAYSSIATSCTPTISLPAVRLRPRLCSRDAPHAHPRAAAPRPPAPTYRTGGLSSCPSSGSPHGKSRIHETLRLKLIHIIVLN